MQELLYVVGIVLVAATGLTVVAPRAGAVLTVVERWLAIASAGVIFVVMLFVFAEVFMRYVMNAPIPGHLEGSELLVPIIVFLAVSYTQAQNGHVGMTLLVENLPPRAARTAEVVTLVLSMLTCAVFAYFSAKYAYRTWVIDDVTQTPPYWRVWPSAAAVPVGFLLLSCRLYLQALHLVAPRLYPQADIARPDHLLSEQVSE